MHCNQAGGTISVCFITLQKDGKKGKRPYQIRDLFKHSRCEQAFGPQELACRLVQASKKTFSKFGQHLISGQQPEIAMDIL